MTVEDVYKDVNTFGKTAVQLEEKLRGLKMRLPATPEVAWYNVIWMQVKPGQSKYQVKEDGGWLGCPEQIGPDDSSGTVKVWKMAGIGVTLSTKAVGEMLAKMSLLDEGDVKVQRRG